MATTKKHLKNVVNPLRWLWRQFLRYWRGGWWHKVVTSLVIFLVASFSSMYGVALWYQHSQKGRPTTLGVTFIADYANSLGVDAHQTFSAILNDLHVKHVRLVSYWSDIEPTQGTYDFSELDWEMAQAQAHGAKVSLSIGLRQPRWPECHAPSWADTSKPVGTWQPQLEQYITTVINRYKHSSALQSYQLENEYFNHFGQCFNFDRNRLSSELTLVKKLDGTHPIIISRSNNYAGLSLGKPLPDEVGISVYRRVWDGVVTHRFVQYPFPSWYYAFLAGAEQILTDRPSVIHELQTEPWPSGGKSIADTSLAEQNQTLDAGRLRMNVTFAEQTGIKDIDMWGAEYWYYRMQILHDPSVWNAARQVIDQANATGV